METLLIIAFAFLLPYLGLCVLLGRKLKVETTIAQANLFLTKQKVLHAVVYDAVSFAVEQRGKRLKQDETMSGEELRAIAVEIVLRTIDDLPALQAVEAVEAMLGKVAGHGASGTEAVRK